MHFFSIFAIVGFSKVSQVMRYSLFFKLLILSTSSFLVFDSRIIGSGIQLQFLEYCPNCMSSASKLHRIFFQKYFGTILIWTLFRNFSAQSLLKPFDSRPFQIQMGTKTMTWLLGITSLQMCLQPLRLSVPWSLGHARGLGFTNNRINLNY